MREIVYIFHILFKWKWPQTVLFSVSYKGTIKPYGSGDFRFQDNRKNLMVFSPPLPQNLPRITRNTTTQTSVIQTRTQEDGKQKKEGQVTGHRDLRLWCEDRSCWGAEGNEERQDDRTRNFQRMDSGKKCTERHLQRCWWVWEDYARYTKANIK